MPNMGIKTVNSPGKPRTSLADALFSATQPRVPAYLFGQPDRSFFATELIGLAGGGSGAVQRELARLADSGLVAVTRQGNRKHYQANPASPIFVELCGIATKTVGLAEPLRWHGYRSDNRYRVFQVLPHALGLPAPVWRVLAKAHEVRNLAEYEGHFNADSQLLRNLIVAAEAVRVAVAALPPL
jgi:hypothetical protein